jgi:hypothetical protein
MAGVSRSAMVVLQEASGLPAGGFAETVGAGFLQAYEQAARVVQSDESLHR